MPVGIFLNAQALGWQRLVVPALSQDRSLDDACAGAIEKMIAAKGYFYYGKST